MPTPVVIAFVVVVLGFFGWTRLRYRAALAQNTDKTFGAIAQRLGLAVQAGDPTINLLYFQQPSRDYKRELIAAGQPYGRAASLRLSDGTSTSNLIVYREITYSFGCFLDCRLARSIPPFEVVLRNPAQYMAADRHLANRPELRESPTGHPLLDAQLIVYAADPRVAPLLVPALELLATQAYLHLAVDGDHAWISFTRIALSYLAFAPEDYLLVLETVACSLEGRPLPARLTAAPAMVASAGAPAAR